MSKKPRQTPLLVDERQPDEETLSILTLLQRLGVAALPAHETMQLALERILVLEAVSIGKVSKQLVKSIQHVGLLQAPSVVLHSGSSVHEPEATFAVIMGRRRVLAAASAGLTSIPCEVYESSTPALSTLLALIENEHRSAAWIREVGDLHHLLDERVGMTLTDLVAVGFERRSLAERLKMAQFPASLLHLLLSGKMSQDTARKIARLNQTQQASLAQHAELEEAITAEQVKHVLRVQINTELSPLQATLAQTWVPPARPASLAAVPENDTSAPLLETEGAVLSCESAASVANLLASLLATLQRFEPFLSREPALQQLHLLMTAFLQQLQVAQREAATRTTEITETSVASLVSSARSEGQQNMQEGDLLHV